jgi:hypothetical protein
LEAEVRENALGEGTRVWQGHHQLAVADRVPDLRDAVVPVDQELLGVVRTPERLAVQAQVELPVVALTHDGRGDPAEPVVEVAVGLLRPHDQVGVCGLGGGEVQLRQRRDHLDAARRRAQVVGQAATGQGRAHGPDSERQRVPERVGAERDRALGQSRHLGARKRVERVLHLERALGLLGLVEARLLAAGKRGHDR